MENRTATVTNKRGSRHVCDLVGSCLAIVVLLNLIFFFVCVFSCCWFMVNAVFVSFGVGVRDLEMVDMVTANQGVMKF